MLNIMLQVLIRQPQALAISEQEKNKVKSAPLNLIIFSHLNVNHQNYHAFGKGKNPSRLRLLDSTSSLNAGLEFNYHQDFPLSLELDTSITCEFASFPRALIDPDPSQASDRNTVPIEEWQIRPNLRLRSTISSSINISIFFRQFKLERSHNQKNNTRHASQERRSNLNEQTIASNIETEVECFWKISDKTAIQIGVVRQNHKELKKTPLAQNLHQQKWFVQINRVLLPNTINGRGRFEQGFYIAADPWEDFWRREIEIEATFFINRELFINVAAGYAVDDYLLKIPYKCSSEQTVRPALRRENEGKFLFSTSYLQNPSRQIRFELLKAFRQSKIEPDRILGVNLMKLTWSQALRGHPSRTLPRAEPSRSFNLKGISPHGLKY